MLKKLKKFLLFILFFWIVGFKESQQDVIDKEKNPDKVIVSEMKKQEKKKTFFGKVKDFFSQGWSEFKRWLKKGK